MRQLLRRLPAPVKARLSRAVGGLGAWPRKIRAGRARGLVLHTPLNRRPYVSGGHEPHVAEALWRHLGPGMAALDAGAHVGYFTLLMARRVGTEGSVFAFEPVAKHARLIRRSAARNRLPQVKVFEQALGVEVAGAWMQRAPNDAMGRVVRERSAGASPIRMTTLDAWAAGREDFPRLDLVKLDVEGQELAVLAGGAGMLRRHRPAVVCEVHWSRAVPHRPRQLVEWLEAAGYAVALIDREDRPAGSLEDVLRHTEASTAPERMAVFHVLGIAAKKG